MSERETERRAWEETKRWFRVSDERHNYGMGRMMFDIHQGSCMQYSQSCSKLPWPLPHRVKDRLWGKDMLVTSAVFVHHDIPQGSEDPEDWLFKSWKTLQWKCTQLYSFKILSVNLMRYGMWEVEVNIIEYGTHNWCKQVRYDSKYIERKLMNDKLNLSALGLNTSDGWIKCVEIW